MKPSRNHSPAHVGTAVSCDVAAWGIVQATPAQLGPLRQNPGLLAGAPLPGGFLKHADDQTVAALAAVLQAIEQNDLAVDFRDWGVIGAPCFLGRATLTVALQRFAAEGAWGISPHLIPHRSLHALSGTISQALRIHGPNFGVGGGPAAAVEAILNGAALISDSRLPGVWVVMTGWHPEPIPDSKGQVPPQSLCQAAALALVPATSGCSGLSLRLVPAPPRTELPNGNNGAAHPDSFSLPMLIDSLTVARASACFVWSLHWGGRIELERLGAGAERQTAAGAPAGACTAQSLRIGAGTEKRT